jgi:hypothetical protein
VAIPALERSIAVSRKLMAADRNDHNARVDFVQAEIRLAGLLRPSDPARALRLFDEAWDVMRAEPEGSFQRAEYLIRTAAEASYALRDLGKAAEARRLAQAKAMFHAGETADSMPVTPHGAEEEWVPGGRYGCRGGKSAQSDCGLPSHFAEVRLAGIPSAPHPHRCLGAFGPPGPLGRVVPAGRR